MIGCVAWEREGGRQKAVGELEQKGAKETKGGEIGTDGSEGNEEGDACRDGGKTGGRWGFPRTGFP